MQYTSPAREVAIDPHRRQREGGYLLLAILLMMAVMIIAATVEAPRIVQQMKRDREEEMIHRGTEYARAVKKFYKKFGRYPTSLEQLDNTNQIRFLRRRYKDPLTKGGKWTLLHYGDIQMLVNPTAPGQPAAGLGAQGQGTAGSIPGSLPGAQPSGFAQNNPQYVGGPGSDGGASTYPGGQPQVVQYPGGPGSDGSGATSTPGTPGAVTTQSGTSPFSNSPTGQPGTGIFGQNPAGGDQTYGGGAIVGVSSQSKDKTIRIYNKKKTYNEWMFIYDPTSDRMNVLLRGPYQPVMIGGAQVGIPAGQMGSQPSGFGQQQSPFGQQPGSTGQQQYLPGQRGPGNQFPPDQNRPQ